MKIYKIKDVATKEEFEGSMSEIASKVGRSRQAVQAAIKSNKPIAGMWKIEYVCEASDRKQHSERLGVTLKCKWCGEEFFKVGTTRVYCSEECKRESLNQMGRDRYKRINAKKSKKNLTLSQIANEAVKAGMTYGKYVEKMGL